MPDVIEPDEALVRRVAWAILTARFYDCEPDMYCNSVDVFRASTVWENHGDDAEFEARAALRAVAPESPVPNEAPPSGECAAPK